MKVLKEKNIKMKSKTKQKGDTEHTCTSVKKRFKEFQNYIQEAGVGCNKLDWEHIKKIQKQLFVLNFTIERWNKEHLVWRRQSFYSPHRKEESRIH